MKKILLSTAVALTLASSLNADFIGAEIGVAAWVPSLSGDIKKGADSIDFEKDLGYENSDSNNFIWAYIDHPVPLIPNLKIQQTNYSTSSNGTMNKEATFAGETFTASASVDSSVTLNQFDIIPYWRILDNWVNLDIGFNFKTIYGNITIESSSANANEDFNVVLPMLYTKARFDLPFSGLSAEADMSYIAFDGNKFSDIKAGIVYEAPMGLGATLGYRQQHITLDDIDDIYGTLDINGAYIGVFYHF